MELNQLSLYGKIIDLEVGDKFWSNGSHDVYYQPKGKNIQNLPRGSDVWHKRSYVSCQKYYNQIRLADNLEKVFNPKHHVTEWVVKYVYKQDRPEYEGLIVMEIKHNDFLVTEVRVERATEKLLFVNPHHPITYLSKIEKNQLLKVHTHWSHTYGMCLVGDYSKLEKIMFDSYLATIKKDIHTAESVLSRKKDELIDFMKLRKKFGFDHDVAAPVRKKFNKPNTL